MMTAMANAVIRDETLTGHEIDSWTLPDLPDRISARELLRLRVREEVARFNATTIDVFRGLVRPTDAREMIRGYMVAPGRRLDWVQQADAACAAFSRNGFIMLAGGRQIDDLDEAVDLAVDPQVAFIKLVPLVGG